MKILLIMALFLFVVCFLFGNIKINGMKSNNIRHRALGSIAFSIIFTLLLGLPILGIMKLLGL